MMNLIIYASNKNSRYIKVIYTYNFWREYFDLEMHFQCYILKVPLMKINYHCCNVPAGG